MTATSLESGASTDRPDGDASAPRRGLRGLLGGTAGVALWTVLVAALLVAAVVLGLRLHASSGATDDREGALQAARQEALNLTSVDGTGIQEDLQRVLEGATGQFRKEFAGQSARLKTVLQQNKVLAQGQVLGAGLVRADDSTATALVLIDSTVRNKAVPDGQVRTYRMQLELEHVGARWLTSTLQFVA